MPKIKKIRAYEVGPRPKLNAKRRRKLPDEHPKKLRTPPTGAGVADAAAPPPFVY